MLGRRLLGDALGGLLLLESCRGWRRFGSLWWGRCGCHNWGGIGIVLCLGKLGVVVGSEDGFGFVSVNFRNDSLFNNIAFMFLFYLISHRS